MLPGSKHAPMGSATSKKKTNQRRTRSHFLRGFGLLCDYSADDVINVSKRLKNPIKSYLVFSFFFSTMAFFSKKKKTLLAACLSGGYLTRRHYLLSVIILLLSCLLSSFCYFISK